MSRPGIPLPPECPRCQYRTGAGGFCVCPETIDARIRRESRLPPRTYRYPDLTADTLTPYMGAIEAPQAETAPNPHATAANAGNHAPAIAIGQSDTARARRKRYQTDQDHRAHVLETKRQRWARNKPTRICLDCPADITAQHGRSVRCPAHAEAHARKMNAARQRRHQAAKRKTPTG